MNTIDPLLADASSTHVAATWSRPRSSLRPAPLRCWITAVLVVAFAAFAPAQVPQLINYQGRVAVDTTNFNGTGQFKFVLVDASGTTSYWSNDGTERSVTDTAATAPKKFYRVEIVKP